jgi:hypothetical protein
MLRLKRFLQFWISASEPYEISLERFPYRDTWPFFKAVRRIRPKTIDLGHGLSTAAVGAADG